MNEGTANLLEILSSRVISLSNEGKWEDAYRSADAAVQQARHNILEGNEEDTLALASTLEIKADLLRQAGHLEDARLNYLEALEIANDFSNVDEMLARINASVAVLYDNVENDEEAIRFYERAIELYERCGLADSLEIADICNNLGFVYRSIGDFKSAEDLLLKGLAICHKSIGIDNEKAATICNNLGALYLKSGYDEQAREMNTLALEARLKALGQKHPDTAQSYANLALALTQCGESDNAKKHFEQAIKIYEHHISEQAHEYASVVENFVEFLKDKEDIKSANSLLKKAQKKLTKLAHHS